MTGRGPSVAVRGTAVDSAICEWEGRRTHGEPRGSVMLLQPTVVHWLSLSFSFCLRNGNSGWRVLESNVDSILERNKTKRVYVFFSTMEWPLCVRELDAGVRTRGLPDHLVLRARTGECGGRLSLRLRLRSLLRSLPHLPSPISPRGQQLIADPSSLR